MYNLITLCLNGTLSCVDFLDIILGDVPSAVNGSHSKVYTLYEKRHFQRKAQRALRIAGVKLHPCNFHLAPPSRQLINARQREAARNITVMSLSKINNKALCNTPMHPHPRPRPRPPRLAHTHTHTYTHLRMSLVAAQWIIFFSPKS